MLSQKLMLMLSTILMEDTVLDTVFILLVMDMVMLDTLLLAMVMGMVLAMPVMGMESVRLSPRLMLSMEPTVDMVMDLDTVHTPLDMVMDTVLDMDMDMDMDTMVKMNIF